MKRAFKISLVFILLLIFISACNTKNSDNENKKKPESKGANVENSESIEAGDERANSEKEQAGTELPKMLMVNGKIYISTGEENREMTCGTADGKVTGSTKASERPTENDQSNFGTGYEYQFWDETQISVKIQNKWIIFKVE